MKVAIAGAGIGGMTLAALLGRAGHSVTLLERASAFGEVGAGIQISPNATRVLAALGLSEDLARVGTVPERIVIRRWDDDAVLLDRPQGDLPEKKYGYPYYNVYRPDLIEILRTALGTVTTRFGTQVVSARNLENGAALDLADGSSLEADVVIGADGIHSAVRNAVFGEAPSRFSELVAYRALVPRSLVQEFPVEVTNRVGPDQHLVSYFVGREQRFFNLVCVVPEPYWDVEGWNEPGSLSELRSHFASWSSTVVDLLDQVQEPVYRWALYDRPPMTRWVADRVALLGDACHPMLPFMAQGACQAIEDAAVLARLLGLPNDASAALEEYQRVRYPRAVRFQELSWRNASTYHLPDGPDQQARDQLYRSLSPDDDFDPFGWIYEYDALGGDSAES